MESGSRRVLKGFLTRARESHRGHFNLSGQSLMIRISMISYPNYKFTFTIKALGMFGRRYGNLEIL